MEQDDCVHPGRGHSVQVHCDECRGQCRLGGRPEPYIYGADWVHEYGDGEGYVADVAGEGVDGG